MALEFHSFADAKPFKFLVGKAGKPFFVHAKLASHQSSTLATLIDGAMVEAEREFAVFDDVEEKTFIRFMEFAYTGDYSVAEPVVVPHQPDIDVENGEDSRGGSVSPKMTDDPDAYPPDVLEEVQVEEPDFDFPPPPRKKDKKKRITDPWAFSGDEPAAPEPPKKSKGEQLWESFQDEAIVRAPSPWRPTTNSDDSEDYTLVFLCHAKLYVFADKYSVEPLLNLVLQKLRLNLSRFILHSRRIGDVVELLQYAYENTADYRDGIDRLRDMVTDYVVCHLEKIVGHSDFGKLLKENGDVAKDLMPKLVRRLD
ncbi:hypothetical protein A1O7_04531 [Cladophialophora yegresii CBS 114405]|uniref:BTB domain-containing protein n=1 Tax=Cladophialophora yegresii CBS 114405 TaxID=1182544 RepID=W9WPT5_9EURO|nr:uncharacterized protein A1O7_04531 [Cladophialophora yegresii CBS 114405]EXJ60379.1 hypothetical protein A1O7_04531 [Cladophialophora yegresii CBS 114405]